MKSVEPNEDESEKDVTLIHYLSLVGFNLLVV